MATVQTPKQFFIELLAKYPSSTGTISSEKRIGLRSYHILDMLDEIEDISQTLGDVVRGKSQLSFEYIGFVLEGGVIVFTNAPGAVNVGYACSSVLLKNPDIKKRFNSFDGTSTVAQMKQAVAISESYKSQ